ncbi:hypothetical protein CYY_008641 [Polysphondylium violaceum]|uniref:ABC3 transporter permease C-terminal domain-containing protein n=1 Tax=Polysphondylium violaceum TaxID=133409 RepID=A0A8J4PLA5_9MYCE|nr:hypothetical protein CYY_008641 [Polysphondylium violaceum]
MEQPNNSSRNNNNKNKKSSLNRSNNSIYYPFYEEFEVEDEEQQYIRQKQYFEKEKNENYYSFANQFHRKTKEIRSSLSRFGFFYLLTWKMVKKDLFSFFLGIFSCFFVVVVVAIGVTVISKIPIIYLNTAQNEVGEFDLVLRSGIQGDPSLVPPRLNFTLVQQLSEGLLEGYLAPRWESSSWLIKASGCMAGADPAFSDWKYFGLLVPGCEPGCMNYACSSAPQTYISLFAIDFEREADMQLGHGWPYPAPPKGTVYISQSLATALDLRVGDYVYMPFPASYYLREVWNATEEDKRISNSIPLTLKVSEIYSDSYGKFSEYYDDKSVALIDYKTFLPFLVEQASPGYFNTTIEELSKVNLYDLATTITYNFKNRIEFYMESDLDLLLRTIQTKTNKLLYRIGTRELNIELPVYQALIDSKNVSMFLSLVLNVLVLILVILSTFLIYSLLMVDVDSKTYETGVLRMIGSSKKNLFCLMLFKALNYCVFSILFGLLSAQLITYGVIDWFEKMTGQNIDSTLTGKAIWLSLSLGFIIPIISMIFPVRRALSNNLHDSLESNRSKVKSIIITIERASDSSFTINTIAIGAFLSVFGFGAYYIFPYSLVSGNLGFLLNSMFVLLIVLVLGLVLIALNFQQLLNRFIMLIFFFWENSAIKSIVLKNMIAHKLRNKKTSILYSVSLGLILLTQIIFIMQQNSTNFEKLSQYGSLIRIQNDVKFKQEDCAALEEYLDSLYPEVQDFSWFSRSQTALSKSGVPRTQIRNLGQVFMSHVELKSVSPNFFSNVQNHLVHLNKVVKDPDFHHRKPSDVSQQLYTTQSSNRIILGTTLETSVRANFDTPLLMVSSYVDIEANQNKSESDLIVSLNKDLVYPMAFMDFASPFRFSKFPTSDNQAALLSFPSYLAYTFGNVTSVRDIPFESILVRAANSDLESTTKLTSKIRNFINTKLSGYPYYVYDYYSENKGSRESVTMVNYFFAIITVLCMSISYFSLSSSMYININEQVKEIGVLRSMGISKFWIIRIYVIESIVLIFSSSIMGLVIGTFLGWAMIEQRKLITQLPLPLEFPWNLLLLVFALSIILGTISSFNPARRLLKNSIINNLKS